MAEFRDQHLTGEHHVDGNIYINCQFQSARLVYKGGVPPGFDRCAFDDANIVFDEAAGRTLAFLRAMAPEQTNMRNIVIGLLPELGLKA